MNPIENTPLDKDRPEPTPAGPTSQSGEAQSIQASQTQPADSPGGERLWLAVRSLCWRELVRFFRQRNRVFGALGQPIIFWLLFSEGLRPRNLDYAHFFPGTLVMILLFTAIFSTISIIEDRREGFLQMVLVAPISRWAMVLGKVLGGTLIATIQGMIFLFLGWLTLDLSLDAATLFQALALMFILSLALTSLGFLIAWRMDSTQGFHAIMSVFLFPMWLLSGAFFPASQSSVMHWIVTINPLTYGVSGLRQLLASDHSPSGERTLEYTLAATREANLQAVAEPSLAVCWLVTLLFAVLTFALATRIAKTRTTGDLL